MKTIQKYRPRTGEKLERVTISLLKAERLHLESMSDQQGVTLSRYMADSAMSNSKSNVQLEEADLNFMLSIVKTVGKPLPFTLLYSLLEKHTSKEVQDV